MRPDEHKKKKNAAYKKKHGISNKAPENEKDKRSKQKDEKKKTHGEGVGLQTAASKGRPASEATSILTTSSSESDDEFVAKKHYRRREIVSNWRKYELEPDQVNRVESRGEDYNKLLNMGGETMSHFRFQEELEWEEDVRCGGGDEQEAGMVAKDFLALNLADIGSSMSCIPIYKLLGIEQNLFPTDQLESQLKLVSEKRSTYLASIKDRHPLKDKEQSLQDNHNMSERLSCPSNEDSSTLSSQHRNHLKEEKSEKQSPKVMRNEAVRKQAACQDISPADRETNSSCKNKENQMFSKVFDKSSATKTPLSLQDDELDDLLDMDVAPQDSDNNSKTLSSTGASCTPKQDDKKEADELEDWLDSILD